MHIASCCAALALPGKLLQAFNPGTQSVIWLKDCDHRRMSPKSRISVQPPHSVLSQSLVSLLTWLIGQRHGMHSRVRECRSCNSSVSCDLTNPCSLRGPHAWDVSQFSGKPHASPSFGMARSHRCDAFLRDPQHVGFPLGFLLKQSGKSVPSQQEHLDMGENQNHQRLAGVGPCFHLPGCHLGYIFLTRSLVFTPAHWWLLASQGEMRPVRREAAA